MRSFLLFLLAASLFACPLSLEARTPANGQHITIFYSNDVRGELEPCG